MTFCYSSLSTQKSIFASLFCFCFSLFRLWVEPGPLAVKALCDPMDCSLPARLLHPWDLDRILEWVAISFSRGYSRPRDRTWVSHIQVDSSLSEPPGKPKLQWAFTLHQSECCAVLSHSAESNSFPVDCSPPGSSVHGDSPGKYTGVSCHPLL